MTELQMDPSKLGTREYWDNFYAQELQNFQHDKSNTGECWFSESGAQEKMVEYIEQLELTKDADVIELGSGNGRLLFSLRDEGVEAGLFGIDYSQASVEFSTCLAKKEGYDVRFDTVDFLSNPDWTSQRFDLVLDKGTLDAIALSGLEYEGRSAVQRYVDVVLPLVKQGGKLIITSCNFTMAELANLVSLDYTEIEYPSFAFGGSQGSTVVTLVFENP